MSSWLIVVVGIIYLAIGADLLYNNKIGLGIAFLGYAASNVGLYLETLK